MISKFIEICNFKFSVAGITDQSAARDSAVRITKEVMDVLHAVARQRQNLKDYGY